MYRSFGYNRGMPMNGGNRFVGGPFILGGITGGLVAPFFYPRPYYYAPTYYYPNNPYYRPY